jgi:hypothetical protein
MVLADLAAGTLAGVGICAVGHPFDTRAFHRHRRGAVARRARTLSCATRASR